MGLTVWRARRRPLINALVAVFALQDREDAAWVRHDTDEYLRAHRAYYALADRTPWWVRAGVWRAAVRCHERAAARRG